tara:strand:+ start:215 stop:421 length:207 start_codon:yes stop_codon:yes gene_type:complete
MKFVIVLFLLFLFASKASAYMIGNSYATLISCDYGYNADYGTSGYTGVYRTTSGNIYTKWFGNNYCPQ